MTEPIAFLNGRDVPLSEAKLSIYDLGLVQGATVTEMVRTFGHAPFRLDQHLVRLEHSLRCVGFPESLSRSEWQAHVARVVAHNAALVPDWQDLGITLFVTAGQNLTYLGAAEAHLARRPTVCVHTFPLPFELWSEKYETGQHLVVPEVRQLPPDTLDPTIKSRSRLHWYVADRQARAVDPQAAALLLDREGHLTETSTSNVCLVIGGELVTPGPGSTLAGVSLDVVRDLAQALGLSVRAAGISVDDALGADEMLCTSTPPCLLPVTRLNGLLIGAGVPGPVYKILVRAWNELVGLDIIGQARDGARARLAEAASSAAPGEGGP